jgi:hypothetical protein
MIRLAKSRTILFNMLIAVLTVIEANFNFIMGQSPDKYMYVVIFVTAANFLLRTITTESLKDKVE